VELEGPYFGSMATREAARALAGELAKDTDPDVVGVFPVDLDQAFRPGDVVDRDGARVDLGGMPELVMLPAFIAVLIALTMLLLGVEIQIDGHSIYVLIAPWEL